TDIISEVIVALKSRKTSSLEALVALVGTETTTRVTTGTASFPFPLLAKSEEAAE
ncbi:hypothetical protein BT96DRAFT_922857, partial [Gymnopus androsaceus JB14]